jgi:hypothetical protein
VHRLEQLVGQEAEVQRRLLGELLRRGAQTKFGREHGLEAGLSYEDFRTRVPRYTYESLWEKYWEAAWQGEPDQTWPGLPGLA